MKLDFLQIRISCNTGNIGVLPSLKGLHTGISICCGNVLCISFLSPAVLSLPLHRVTLTSSLVFPLSCVSLFFMWFLPLFFLVIWMTWPLHKKAYWCDAWCCDFSLNVCHPKLAILELKPLRRNVSCSVKIYRFDSYSPEICV